MTCRTWRRDGKTTPLKVLVGKWGQEVGFSKLKNTEIFLESHFISILLHWNSVATLVAYLLRMFVPITLTALCYYYQGIDLTHNVGDFGPGDW